MMHSNALLWTAYNLHYCN